MTSFFILLINVIPSFQDDFIFPFTVSQSPAAPAEPTWRSPVLPCLEHDSSWSGWAAQGLTLEQRGPQAKISPNCLGPGSIAQPSWWEESSSHLQLEHFTRFFLFFSPSHHVPSAEPSCVSSVPCCWCWDFCWVPRATPLHTWSIPQPPCSLRLNSVMLVHFFTVLGASKMDATSAERCIFIWWALNPEPRKLPAFCTATGRSQDAPKHGNQWQGL